MSFTLKNKINLAFLSVFVVISLLFIAVLVPIQKHRLNNSYETIVVLLEVLVERDNEEIANEIFDSRLKALKIRLNQFLDIEDVIGVNVFDNSGTLLVSEGLTATSSDSSTEVLKNLNKRSTALTIQVIDEHTLSFTTDIAFLSETVGVIEIHYSLEKVLQEQRYILFLFSGVFVALLTGSLFILNFILSKAIIKPIELLNASAQRIASGKYDKKISQFGKDEVGMLAMNLDSMQTSIKEKIEHLQETESILRHREGQLSLLTNNMADVISLTDPNVNLVYVSPSAEKIFGYNSQDLIGKPGLEFVHPDDIDQVFKMASLARQEKKETILLQYRWQHADGNYIWVESSTQLLYTETGESDGAVFGTRNINERVRLEEERAKMEKQLSQSQKLESIGLLAGGVAHDLNNLLSPILGYSELLLAQLKSTDTTKEKIEQIHKAGLGARDLVRQLLAFGRKQTLEYKPLDINSTLQKYTKLIRRTIPEDIEIKIIPSPDVQTIMADHGQIEQVIMNLAVNAADSMPVGGELTIETDMVVIDDDYVANHLGVEIGSYLMMSVSDKGAGMDENTLSQVFEPFFTTKGSKGTGLGLATVYGIVKQHSGNIYVYSEPGKGTTFKVYLPSNSIVSSSKTIDKDREEKSFKGTETILIVEDNAQVLEVAKNVLEQYDYAVMTAENGEKALDIIGKYSGSIDLLLTDIVMPKMNGKELSESAKKIYPNLQVIYMSGYTPNAIVHRGVLDKGIHFIQKPFSVKALCQKVRDVIDSNRHHL